MLNRELIIFDVETTGLDPRVDYIIELSAIKYDRNLEIIDKYLQRFDVPIQISEEATAVHGITNKDLEGYPSFQEEIYAIAEFFGGCDIGGYNVLFDLKFLLSAFDRCGKILRFDFMIVDVMKIYAKYEPRTLSAVYKRLFQADLEDAHSAEADVIATGMVLKELVKRGFCELDINQLSDLSDTSNLADIAGKFIWDKANVLLWNFGKYYGKPVTVDRSYCNWVLNSDFPLQSKIVLSEYLGFKGDDDE